MGKPPAFLLERFMDWKQLIEEERAKPYFKELMRRVYEDIDQVLPPEDLIFRAFELTEFKDVKVVILGQDPYPLRGKATGLSFGVPNGWPKINSSLENVLNEVRASYSLNPIDLSMESWARQGVLMLNTRLTVLEGKPMSHAGIGWEKFTKRVLQELSDSNPNIIYMLWGREAQKAARHVKGIKLETSHPCKFSGHRGFQGCAHFSRANAQLLALGESAIDWVADKRPNLRKNSASIPAQ